MRIITFFLFIVAHVTVFSQRDAKTTEIWEPKPPVVVPGTNSAPPSDAIILFDNNSLAAWQQNNGNPPSWTIGQNEFTVKPGSGGIMTKQKFGDCQLHIEWRTPSVVKGNGQGRGNSGIFLMGRYEIQILDNYNNETYVNGQAASVYKQHIPLVNACRPPGEWQSYDIIFIAPRFSEKGNLVSPARITVFHNGVLVQNNVVVWGSVSHDSMPKYEKHEEKLPLGLQDHGDLVSFRNIWIREL